MVVVLQVESVVSVLPVEGRVLLVLRVLRVVVVMVNVSVRPGAGGVVAVVRWIERRFVQWLVLGSSVG